MSTKRSMAARALLLVASCAAVSNVGHAQPAAEPAPSQDAKTITEADRAMARQLFRAGARAYDAARYDVSVEAFDQAYELIPRPELRYSAAQALRRQYALTPDIALLRKARDYYRAYASAVKTGARVADAALAITAIDQQLRDYAATHQGAGGAAGGIDPAVPPPKKSNVSTMQLDSGVWGATATVTATDGSKVQRQEVVLAPGPQWLELPPGDYKVVFRAAGYRNTERQARVELGRTTFVDETLSEKPARLSLVGMSGVDVLVDGRPVGRTPLLRPLELPRGRHRLVAGSTGHDAWVRDLDLDRGSEEELSIAMDMSSQRVASWVVLSGAAGLTISGIVMGGIARRNGLEAENIRALSEREQRPLTLAEAQRYNDVLGDSNEQTVIAVGLFSGGLVMGGIGLLTYMLDEPDLYEATVSAAAMPGGASGPGAPPEGAPTTPPPMLSPSLESGALTPLFDATGRAVGAGASLSGSF